jgi:hypothetical protein
MPGAGGAPVPFREPPGEPLRRTSTQPSRLSAARTSAPLGVAYLLVVSQLGPPDRMSVGCRHPSPSGGPPFVAVCTPVQPLLHHLVPAGLRP